jgi:hypothetical protein
VPNALDAFRAQREAADAMYERVQEIAALLAQVRRQADAVAGNADLHAVLQREQTWLSQAQRTVAEVRAWREREARQFWRSVVGRWALALAFALASAWAAGAGYAYVVTPYAEELARLRGREVLIESIEERLMTMTPAQRREFDSLMKRDESTRR